MAQTKLYKPKTCEQCPVIRIDKGTLVCGVARKLKTKVHDTQEMLQMWRKCPIDWDK